jgi:hypothetical protein
MVVGNNGDQYTYLLYVEFNSSMIEGMDNIDDDEEEEEIDDESGEGDDMGDLGDDDDVEEGDDADDDEDSSGSDDDVVIDEIVEQFMRTFHNGDYDQEFDNALSSDRSAVVPSTRPTQASYNKPDNWRERNRIGLEKVKEQIQECINSVMYNESGRVYLRLGSNTVWNRLVENEEPIVWHEPVLDDYWKNLKQKSA